MRCRNVRGSLGEGCEDVEVAATVRWISETIPCFRMVALKGRSRAVTIRNDSLFSHGSFEGKIPRHNVPKRFPSFAC